MMRYWKKLTAALLALVMMLGLAACGGGKTETGVAARTEAQSAAKGTQETALEPGMVQVNYRASEITLPEGLARVEKIAVSGGKLYAAGLDNMTPGLFAMNLESGDWTRLTAEAEEPQAEGAPVAEFGQVSGLAASGERVFLLMTKYGETGMVCTVMVYDSATGEELGEAALEGVENDYLLNIFALGDKLAVYNGGTIMIYSQEGAKLCESKESYDVVMTADGKLLAGKNDEESGAATVFEVNSETGEGTELCRAEGAFRTPCVSENGAVLAEGNSVYALDPASGKTEHLFDWGDTGAGIMLSPEFFFASAAGDYFIADSLANSISRIRFFENAAPRRELIIGVGRGVAGTYLSKAVSKFNAENTEYLAREVYYTQEEADKILTELIAGKGPDVLFLGSSTDRESAFTRVKVDKGLCVDLMPYLENDPDVSPEDFVPGVLESMTEDGQLYKLFPSFRISSVVAPKEVADGLGEWTPEVMMELANNLPEEYTLFNTFQREFFLEDLCALASVRWVNRVNGTCSLDTGEFATWLELCKNMEYIGGNNVEYGLMNEGTMVPSMASYFKQTMGDYAIIGYPSAEGVGSGYFGSGVGGFSILQSSKNPDGAWAFLKTLLTPEVQSVLTGFECPAIKSSFDKYLEKSVKNENTDVTEEDAQKFMDAIANCHGRSEGDAVTDIITEEAQKYFGDQRSLEDTVAIIQSRAGIYLAEQKE